jgi:hypothetical protein
MKLTRRELATVLAPAAALAQTPTAGNPPSGGDAEVDAARARMKANGDTLARQEVPMDLEPAFQFKA